MTLKPVPAIEASGKRHDVPADIRQEVVTLKAAMDRVAATLGRHWVADEQIGGVSEMLLDIARRALILQQRQREFEEGIRDADR